MINSPARALSRSATFSAIAIRRYACFPKQRRVAGFFHSPMIGILTLRHFRALLKSVTTVSSASAQVGQNEREAIQNRLSTIRKQMATTIATSSIDPTIRSIRA